MKLSKYSLLILPVVLFLCGATACNTDDDADIIYSSAANTMVRTFAMSADYDVLPNLAHRYFTIDLVNGMIFNPDSFPYGTDISRLVPDITFSSPSSVEISEYRKSDGTLLETHDYLENENDTIDFTNDVKMKVVAADKTTTQTYRIEVRVHQIQADSLVWTTVGTHSLPTSITATRQKTVTFGGAAYCFTADDATYSLSVSTAPAVSWDKKGAFTPWGDTLALPSIVVADDVLYALCGAPDAQGNQQLCCSTDGLEWNEIANARFSSLIGMWENRLVGIARATDGYCHAAYEAEAYTVGAPIVAEFPVAGHSATIAYSDNSFGSSQIYFFGGRRADDTYSGHIWAYDGARWAAISNVGLVGGAGATVSPREGALFFSYYKDEYNAVEDYFTRKPYFYILGGRDASGIRNDLYYTNTIGGYWEHAAQGTPLYVTNRVYTPRAFASAYVAEETPAMPASSTMSWRWFETPYLDHLTRSDDEPIPYVYIFGGYDRRDNFIDEICRGVILRFTF